MLTEILTAARTRRTPRGVLRESTLASFLPMSTLGGRERRKRRKEEELSWRAGLAWALVAKARGLRVPQDLQTLHLRAHFLYDPNFSTVIYSGSLSSLFMKISKSHVQPVLPSRQTAANGTSPSPVGSSSSSLTETMPWNVTTSLGFRKKVPIRASRDPCCESFM